MTEKRPGSLTSAALLTYGTNLAVAVLSLVNVLVVARSLGPSGRGSVAFLTTIAYLTSQLVTLGVHQANANIAAREPKLTSTLAGNSVLIALAAGGFGVAVVELLVVLFPSVGGPSTTGLRWLALASVPFLVFQNYAAQLTIAHYGFRVTNAAWMVTPVVNVVVNATCALAGVLTVGIALGSWITGQLIGTFMLAAFIARSLGGYGRPDRALARHMVGFGLKSHITRIFTLGNYRFDQWLMGALSSSRQLGYYSVAVAWAEALFFLPTALATVQRPDLARAGESDAARQVGPVFRVAMWITLASVIAMVLLAPVLCVTIFGDEFRASVDQLRILALGAFGIVALKLFGNTLVAQRRPLLETGAVVLAFGVILALDVLLIPGLDGLGAAIASSVAYTVGGVAIVAVFCRGLRVPARELLPRPSDVTSFLATARALLRRPRVAS